MAFPIGTLGTIDTLTIGSRVYTDLTSLISLVTFFSSNTNATFRKGNASAGYAVTTGKTLAISSVRTQSTNSGKTVTFLLQSDNDVGLDSATAFTNAVYEAGSSNLGFYYPPTVAQSNYIDFVSTMSVAALKYLSASGSSGQNNQLRAFGYET